LIFGLDVPDGDVDGKGPRGRETVRVMLWLNLGGISFVFFIISVFNHDLCQWFFGGKL